MSTFTSTNATVRFTDTDGDVSFTATRPAVTFTAAYQSVSSSGGATDLDDLTDVTVTTPASGDVLRYDGSVWENVTSIEAHGNTYQHTDVIATATSPYIMGADDRIVITTGSAVTLPDAETMEGQEVTIYSGAGQVVISPYAGQSILGLPTYTLNNAADCGKFVAVNATAITGGAITWTWAATLRAGGQWDLPDWSAETQGSILAVNSTPEPGWVDVGTANQILTVSGAGAALQWKSPADIEYGLTDADIAYDGSGLFDTADTIGQGVNAAEGALDRWQFVKAYSTTNVNLASYVGVGSVATQPTLDDGIAPPEDTYCDVYLFGQTTTSENGLYSVDGATGVWTKYTEPTQFDPGNGHRVNCTENGANFIYLDDGIVASVARSRRVSDFATAAEASGTGQWYRMPDASPTLTSSPGGSSTVDVVSNVATARILGRTTSGTGDSEELTAAQARSLLSVAPAPRLVASGHYSASGTISSTATGLTSNRLYFVPFHVPRTTTFDRIAVNHAATAAGASSIGRLGIYNNSGDLPGSLLLDAGSIDLSTAAAFKTVTISQELTEGVWWIGFVAQVTSGSPTFTASPPFVMVPNPAGDNLAAGTFYTNSVTGSLPSTPSPAASLATGIPVIYMRAA